MNARPVADGRRRRVRQLPGRTFVAFVAIVMAVGGGCVAPGPPHSQPAADASIALRLIGKQVLAHRMQFGGTTVGGLSGIDYDAGADLYYLISDDPSAFSPTRFYTARLSIDADRFDDVALQTVVPLRRADGSTFPAGAADAEAVRHDPATKTLVWTSEGGHDRAGTVQPFVRRSGLDGRAIGKIPLHPMFRFDAARGPRDNLVFEGASLSPDGRSLWVAMEGPLRQDGAPPTFRHGAWSRITRHDRDVVPTDRGFGPVAAQFAYRIDPIPGDGAWTPLYAQNGVAEILATDARHLLVLERALVLGAGWRIRLFEADWSGATDVKAFDALPEADGPTSFVPMTKRLVLDFDTLGIGIDNLEGLCFGPTLANGHRTLVFVSDDNFNPGQVTQFVAFEILPR